MAEPRPFQFDAKQRSVGATASRRRSTWPWIALSLALHGALVLFALVGAARGGHTELLGTFEVTFVGTPSEGDPDIRSAEGDTETKPEPATVPRPEAPPDAPPSPAVPQAPTMPQPSAAQPTPEPPKDPARPESPATPSQATPPREAAPSPSTPDEPRRSETEPPKRPEIAAPPDPKALPRKIERAEAAPVEPRRNEAAQAPKPPPSPAAAMPASLPRAKTPREAASPAKPAPRAGLKQAPPGQTASLGSPNGGERRGRSDTDDTSGMLNINLNPRFRAPPAPPIYPRQSIERDEEGVVVVRAFVDPTGAPQRVMVWKGSGYPLLDEAALKAVQGWRFEPMLREGRATASWVQVPVRFRLN
jgi:protein TonB